MKYDKEFDDKFKLLANILAENKEKVKKIKTLVEEIQAIKLSNPQGSKPGADSPALKKALQEAKEASEKYGSGSKEAVQAWMTVEEIASADQSEVTSGNLDDECLIQTIEAVSDVSLFYIIFSSAVFTYSSSSLTAGSRLYFSFLQCEALEEINRIVDLQKFEGSRYSG